MMKLLDKILYKRLEKIRGELDFYLAEKAERRIEYQRYEESLFVESPMVYQDSSGKTMDKFLNAMPLKEDVSDFDFEDECVPTYSQTVPSQTIIQPSEIRIPDFLYKESRKKSIDEVLEQKSETFSTMLLRLIDEKGLKDSEVYKNANIDRRLFSKIRGDEDYVPSKKTAISFCLALQLEMEEAKRLLETAGYALSNASRFDLIIMYLIENKEYNIHFANIVLEDYGEGTLSK